MPGTEGYPLSAYSLSKAQALLGAQVHIISGGYPKLQRHEIVNENLTIHRIFDFGTSTLNEKAILHGIASSIRIAKLISRNSNTHCVIHGHDISSLIYAITRNVWKKFLGPHPLILTAHGELWRLTLQVPPLPLAETLFIRSHRLCCLKADKIIAVSDSMARDLVLYYGIPRERIAVVPNGVDIERFNPLRINGEDLKRKLGLRDSKIILFVGSLSRKKGIHTLAKAIPLVVERIPEAKFVFIGKGQKGKQILSNVAKDKNGKAILLTGMVPYDLIPKYYAMGDLLVLPSIYDAAPKVVLEAMAMEKPVVATRTGGIPEMVVDGETGLLAEPGDHKGVANAIIDLLSNERSLRRFGQDGRKRVVKYFNWIDIAHKTLQIYYDLISSK